MLCWMTLYRVRGWERAQHMAVCALWTACVQVGCCDVVGSAHERTLLSCTRHTVAQSSQALQQLVDLDVPSSCIALASCAEIPPRTRLVAAQLYLALARMHPEAESVVKVAATNEFETMVMTMVSSEDAEAQQFGAQLVAASTDTRKRKRYVATVTCAIVACAAIQSCTHGSLAAPLGRHFRDLGAAEKLLDLARDTDNSHTAKHALGALVNLTTERDMQAAVVRHGVHVIFQFARAVQYPMCQAYASKVIENAKHHPANRTSLYKCELHYRTRDWRGDHEGTLTRRNSPGACTRSPGTRAHHLFTHRRGTPLC